MTSQVDLHAQNNVVKNTNILCMKRWKKSIEITCISCCFIYNIQIMMEKKKINACINLSNDQFNNKVDTTIKKRISSNQINSNIKT